LFMTQSSSDYSILSLCGRTLVVVKDSSMVWPITVASGELDLGTGCLSCDHLVPSRDTLQTQCRAACSGAYEYEQMIVVGITNESVAVENCELDT